MRSILRKILLAALPFFLMAVVNLVADPWMLFPDRHQARFQQYSDWLNGGSLVAFPSDIDERALQRARIGALQAPPELVVLGSSRVMQLGAEAFPDTEVLNSAVSGAVLEDFIALTELYRAGPGLPKRLVVGLDPWVFNPLHGEQRWRTLDGPYRRGFTELAKLDPKLRASLGEGAWSSLKAKLYELINPEYFVTSLSYLMGPGQPFATQELSSPTASWFLKPDGSIEYSVAARNESPKARLEKARRNAQRHPIYRLKSFGAPDESYKALLEAWLEYLERQGVETTVLLLPYHPLVYESIEKHPERYRGVQAIEQFAKSLSSESLTVVGSYDPENLGWVATDFIDGMHSTREAIARFVRGTGG